MRRGSGTTGRLAIGAGAAAALAAVGAVLARRRRRGAAPATTGRTPIAAAEERYACACGAVYGVSGIGRHRVFWPADATVADAVLEDHCPACGRAWPAEETAAA